MLHAWGVWVYYMCYRHGVCGGVTYVTGMVYGVLHVLQAWVCGFITCASGIGCVGLLLV